LRRSCLDLSLLKYHLRKSHAPENSGALYWACMKFKVGDIIFYESYRQVMRLCAEFYTVRPMFSSDQRASFRLNKSYVDGNYKKVTKLELLLLGLDLENEALYNEEKEQT
jgi:hypothetical protein